MKAFKTMGSKRGKGRRGFTLIELLIVMVILAILAGVVVMAVGGIFGQAKSRAYDTIKPQIQNGVTAYTTSHNGELPDAVSNVTYVIVTEANQSIPLCFVFDLCSIVGEGQILRQVPDGCYSDADGETNFDYTAGTPCSPTGDDHHYIWVLDPGGNVYSICDMGLDGYADGSTDMIDGYHGIDTEYSWDVNISYTEDYWP